MFGLALLLILLWPSAMLYVLLLAVSYRITKREDQHWLASLMFVGAMIAGWAFIGSSYPLVHSIGDPLDHLLSVPWQYWLYVYTLVMAGLGTLAFGVSIVTTAFTGLVGAIRGGG